MGFLDRFFDSDSTTQDASWNSVSNESDIDNIFLASNDRIQIVLKHSMHCGSSLFAKRNLETIDSSSLDDMDVYLIDVIRQRMISRYFAEKVGVRHESPQLFVLRDENIVWHGSHHRVIVENLLAAVNKARG